MSSGNMLEVKSLDVFYGDVQVLWDVNFEVKQGEVVGIDLVEVAPAYDPSGITGFLAAQVLLNLLGYIFEERHAR